MTLLETVKDLFRTGVELWKDEILITNDKGVTLRKDTKLKRQLSLAAISCSSAQEWYLCSRLSCPVGTIIEDFEESSWTKLFEEVTALCRVALTKGLLDERNSKSATILLKLLEKRDAAHWADKDRQISIDTKDSDKSININIVAV